MQITRFIPKKIFQKILLKNFWKYWLCEVRRSLLPWEPQKVSAGRLIEEGLLPDQFDRYLGAPYMSSNTGRTKYDKITRMFIWTGKLQSLSHMGERILQTWDLFAVVRIFHNYGLKLSSEFRLSTRYSWLIKPLDVYRLRQNITTEA